MFSSEFAFIFDYIYSFYMFNIYTVRTDVGTYVRARACVCMCNQYHTILHIFTINLLRHIYKLMCIADQLLCFLINYYQLLLYDLHNVSDCFIYIRRIIC